MVKDSTGKPTAHVAVHVAAAKDTLLIYTNAQGGFALNSISFNKIQLFCESGSLYSDPINYQFDGKSTEVQLPPIMLKQQAVKLKEVVVKGTHLPMVFKQDTVEFDAMYYQHRKEDRLQDLLQRLPGVRVDDDGKVTYMGKSLEKLKVNGADFFSGNLTEFLKQLPADILSKLQIVDDYGEIANFTGRKVGEPQKVLNLVTLPGMNNGKFGDASIIAGTNKQYGITANANYWQDTKQISAGAQLNKTDNSSGNVNTNIVRANYRDKLKHDITLALAYNYSQTTGNANVDTYTQSVVNSSVLNNISSTNSTNNNGSQRISFDLRNKAQGINYWFLTPEIDLDNNGYSAILSSTQTGQINQNLNQVLSSKSHTPMLKGTFAFMHRFKKQGRFISFNLDVNDKLNNRTNEQSGTIQNIYTTGIKDSVFKNTIADRTTGRTVNAELVYTDQITKRSSVDITSSFQQNQQMDNLYTLQYATNGYAGNKLISNQFNSLFTAITLGADFRYNNKSLRLILGFNVKPTILTGSDGSESSLLPKQKGWAFTPTANLYYTLSTQNTLNISYSATNMPPDVRQLNPVTDQSNIQNVIVGNPDLKPTLTHRISMDFGHVGSKGSVFNVNVGSLITQNQIITNTRFITDSLSNSQSQQTTYLNANGSYTVSGGYYYALPAYKKNNVNYNLTFNGNINLNRNVYFTDNLKSVTQIAIISQSANLTGKFKKLGLGLTAAYNQSANHQLSGSGINTDFRSVMLGMGANVDITPSLTIKADASKNMYLGLNGGLSNNPFIINTSLQQKLFKDEAGTIQLQAFDLLNQANNTTQSVSANSVVSSRVKYTTSYVKLTFQMRLSHFGKQSTKHNN